MSWGWWVLGCSELVAQHHLVPADGKPDRLRFFSISTSLFSQATPGGPPGSQTLLFSTPDVANPSAITDAAKIVEGKLNGMGLNLLINNAGIYTPSSSLETADTEDMIRTYKTNAVGPMLMAQVWIKLWGWRSPWRGNLAQPRAVSGHDGDLGVFCQAFQGCGKEGTVLGLCSQPKPSAAPPQCAGLTGSRQGHCSKTPGISWLPAVPPHPPCCRQARSQ